MLPPPVSDVASLRALPHPPLWGPLGDFPLFSADPLGRSVELARRFGDVVYMPLGPVHTVLVSHPHDIEHLLVDRRNAVLKDEMTRRLRWLLGDGMLTAEGERWRRHRRIAAPSFQPGDVARWGDAMVAQAAEAAAGLAPGEVEVHRLFSAVTLRIVAQTLFGTEPPAAVERISARVETIMSEVQKDANELRSLLPPSVWTPGRARAVAARDALDAMLAEVIARGRARVGGDDLLARLLGGRDEDGGGGLDDAEVRDEVMTVFLAGHETTALALSFAVWLLSRHPAVYDELRAELDTVLGGRDARAADLPHLPVLDSVLKETLRLYPPAWMLGRDLLEPATFGGRAVPAGAEVLASPWVVHRDPRWWRAPLAFRPGRWRSNELDGQPRFAYFPFGGGPRVCVGLHFARMEAALVLAAFVRRWRLEPAGPAAARLVVGITVRPADGLWVRLAG